MDHLVLLEQLELLVEQAGGSEPSFIDQGFEAVQINEEKMSTTRIVCSQINETTRLTALLRIVL